jgi:hypothetical protein
MAGGTIFLPRLVCLLALASAATVCGQTTPDAATGEGPSFRLNQPLRDVPPVSADDAGGMPTDAENRAFLPSDGETEGAWPDLGDLGASEASPGDAIPAESLFAPAEAVAPAEPAGPTVVSEADAEAALDSVGTPGSETTQTGDGGRFESGGVELRYSFNVLQGYNSNVTSQRNNPVASLYTDIDAGIDLVFGGSRTDVVFGFDLGATYYYNNSRLQNDGIFPNGQLTLDIDYAATQRLDLSFNSTTALLAQPSFTIVGAPNSFLGNYVISDTSFSASYRWLPKLETITGYSAVFWYYFEPLGANFSRVEQTFDHQFLYLWKPTTALVLEYRFATRTYWLVEDYDSVTNFLLFGFNHSLNPRSVLNFRGGAEQSVNQIPGRGGTTTYLGPFGQLELNYSLRPETVVALQARYGVTASSQVGYNQNQQFLSGISLRHAFGRRLTGNLFFNYQNNFYDQPDGFVPDYTTDVYNTGLSATFAISQIWSINAGYTYTGLISSNDNLYGSYTQNLLFIGTNFSF